MQILPTTELMSAVLRIPISHVQPKDNSYLALFQNGETACYKTINIYELMHMMKKWAHTLGFMIQSYPYNDIWRADLLRARDTDEVFKQPTEPEAVAKACLWILHSKDSQCNKQQ